MMAEGARCVRMGQESARRARMVRGSARCVRMGQGGARLSVICYCGK